MVYYATGNKDEKNHKDLTKFFSKADKILRTLFYIDNSANFSANRVGGSIPGTRERSAPLTPPYVRVAYTEPSLQPLFSPAGAIPYFRTGL